MLFLPKISLRRPSTMRRCTSSCQRRSCACTYPAAKNASRSLLAVMYGTPCPSRRISTGALMPATVTLPPAGGSAARSCRQARNPAAAQGTSTNTPKRDRSDRDRTLFPLFDAGFRQPGWSRMNRAIWNPIEHDGCRFLPASATALRQPGSHACRTATAAMNPLGASCGTAVHRGNSPAPCARKCSPRWCTAKSQERRVRPLPMPLSTASLSVQ